jgi:hypothetical protein
VRIQLDPRVRCLEAVADTGNEIVEIARFHRAVDFELKADPRPKKGRPLHCIPCRLACPLSSAAHSSGRASGNATRSSGIWCATAKCLPGGLSPGFSAGFHTFDGDSPWR